MQLVQTGTRIRICYSPKFLLFISFFHENYEKKSQERIYHTHMSRITTHGTHVYKIKYREASWTLYLNMHLWLVAVV